jgi:hypothetical protein
MIPNLYLREIRPVYKPTNLSFVYSGIDDMLEMGYGCRGGRSELDLPREL